MKKLFLISLVTLLAVSITYAGGQSIQIRPYAGYGLGAGQMVSGADYSAKWNDTKGDYDFSKDENIYYGFGAGLKFGLGVQLGIADNLAAELSGGYSIGSEVETSKYSESGSSWDTNYSFKETEKLSTSYIPVALTIKVKTKIGQITPYAGFGPLFALGAKSIGKYSSDETSGGVTTKIEIERETTYKMGIGFNAVLGADYDLSDSLSLFGQVRLDQVSLKLDKAKLTKFTIDGEDQLKDMDTCEKETTYGEDDPKDNSSKTDSPDIERTENKPFNSVTIAIGVALKFYI